MSEINTYYKTLNRAEKVIFRERLLKLLKINYMSFYNWINRNNVPKKYQKDYEKFKKNKHLYTID